MVAAVAWVGHCWAGTDASQHWGVRSPGTGSTAVHPPTAKGLFMGLSTSPAVTSGMQESKIHDSTGQTELQSRDAPALNLHSGHGLQVNDAFCTEEIRAACLPRDAFTALTHFKRESPCVGCLAGQLGGQPMGHYKSLHSPHSYASPQTFLFTVSD